MYLCPVVSINVNRHVTVTVKYGGQSLPMSLEISIEIPWGMDAAVTYKLLFKDCTNVTHNLNEQNARDWFVLCGITALIGRFTKVTGLQ